MPKATLLPAVPAVLAVLAALVALAASACGDDTELEEDTGPMIGVMELPISLRNGDPQPTDAVRIEISPTEMRLDGHALITLERGMVPDSERSNDRITKLSQAITSGAARRSGALRLHVNTPYETTALVLSTLKAANINSVGFEVRKPGGSADTGWLVIASYGVEPKDAEPETFAAPHQRRWDELVAVWEEMYTACRRDHYVDCSPHPVNPAPGGAMEISIFARGSALKVELTRFGMDEEDETAAAAQKRGPEMIEGVPPVGGGSAYPGLQPGDEIPPPPVTSGAFTWRFEAATDEGLSPISGAFRPLCGAAPCGVVVTGDPETMTMRLVSFIGAAFPNGTEAPALLFEIPRRSR
jgi:hypothetical protein